MWGIQIEMVKGLGINCSYKVRLGEGGSKVEKVTRVMGGTPADK